MIETYATATDFRKHLAQIANCVAYREDRCVVMRHGQEMVALVSYEDLQFLRKYRPRKIGPPSVDVFSPRAAWGDYYPEPPVPQPPPPPVLGEEGQEVVKLIDPFDELLDWLSRAASCLAVNRISIPHQSDG